MNSNQTHTRSRLRRLQIVPRKYQKLASEYAIIKIPNELLITANQTGAIKPMFEDIV